MQLPPDQEQPATLGADASRTAPRLRVADQAPSPTRDEIAKLASGNKNDRMKALELQLGAMRGVVGDAHKLAQTALKALSALAQGHVSVGAVKLHEETKIVVIRIPRGHQLDEDVGNMLQGVLGFPILELPEGFGMETLSDAELERIGYTKRTRLVDASGSPI